MDRLLRYIIKSFYTINEAYSPKVIQQLIDKFKEEIDDFGIDPISDDSLKIYIKRFDQLKNSPKIKEKDLLKWNINDLVRLITQAPSSVDTELNADDEYIINSGTPVFENDNIQIFHAGTQEQCTRLKSFDDNNNSGESWCIGRGSFSSYRFSDYRNNPSFYYVVDKEKFNEARGQYSHTDFDKSFFVVQIRENGDYVYTPRSNSPHESNTMDWEGLTNAFPILGQQITPDVLRYIPHTTSEKMMGKYKREEASLSEFLKFSFEAKKQYLVLKNNSFDKFKDVLTSTFVTKVLPKIPKLMDFISVTHGIIDQDELLSNLELFSNQHSKSIIQNLRDIDIDILKNPTISWDIKKLLVKYAKDKFDSMMELSLNNEENFIFIVSTNNDNLTISAATKNDYYPSIKITPRNEKYLEGIDLSNFTTPTLLKLVKDKKLTLNLVSQLIVDIKANNIDGYEYKEHEEKSYIINTESSLIYVMGDNTLDIMSMDNPEILSLLGDGYITTAINSFTQLNVEGDLSVLTNIVASAPLSDRIITNPDINDGRPIILFAGEDKVFVIPTEYNKIETAALSLGTFQHNRYEPHNHYHAPSSLDIYEEYFAYLRSTNQFFEGDRATNLLARVYGVDIRSKFNFIASDPPLNPDATIALKYWEPNDTYYIINTQFPSNSHKISISSGKRVKANISRRLYTLMMGEAPVVAQDDDAPDAPAAPGTRRGRPVGGARTYDLDALPELETHPTLSTAEELITEYGFNWEGLSDEAKFKLHHHAIARSTINNRGVTRRDRQLPYNVDIQNYYTVGQCALYIINQRTLNDERNGYDSETIAMNVVIQPGNGHWLLTTDNATRMTTANVGDVIGNLNESDDIKKYILKETIYQQNKETMKISELQALVKEAIQEVLSENQPERSPETPDRDTETLPDPGTKPGRTTRRRKIGNPSVDPNPKAILDLEEAEKEIMNMITKRFKAGQDA